MRLAERRSIELQQQGKAVRLYAVGKKAQGYFSFRKYHIERSFLGVTDTPGYGDARAIANTLMDEYASGAVDAVEMFFTEAVTFAYPMPESPVMGIPLGLNHAVLAYDGPLDPETLLENVHRSIVAVFSMGVGLNVHRIILPPTWRDSSLTDPAATTDALLELRQSLQEAFDLVGQASLRAGLRGWEVTKQ